MQCFNDIFETKCPNKLFQAKNLKLLSKLDIFLSKLFTTRPNFTVNSLLVLQKSGRSNPKLKDNRFQGVKT